MKNILKTGIATLMMLLVLLGCDPKEDSDYSLGEMPVPEQLDFTATPTASKPNVIDLANTSQVTGIATWDFGNGTTAKGESVQGKYPFKGEYTITMTLYTSGGSASITQNVTIENDDMSLLDTPMYNALTGGAGNTGGKTWVFDQYHNGHMGVGSVLEDSPNWWTCPAEGKSHSSLYTQEFTFTQIGVKLEWKNNGYIYTNEAGKNALADMGYPNSAASPDGDYDVEYAPKASYTFSLNESEGILTLNGGAFFGHYAGTSTYQIVELTDDELYVKCASTTESGNEWWYRFIPKDQNVKPVVPLKAVELNEDFESETPKVAFVSEDMGSRTDPYYSNPAPVGVNTSGKVFLYQKPDAFYSNVYFQADGYKFDLTEQNKITMKVFIPSYNDYDTEFPVAGDWITDNQLKPQLSVKLQDSGKGGDAYTTQTEIVKADLEMDKWIDLTFDFSTVSSREDYDKIVIQFGGEGHAAPGIFFFDDFAFTN